MHEEVLSTRVYVIVQSIHLTTVLCANDVNIRSEVSDWCMKGYYVRGFM